MNSKPVYAIEAVADDLLSAVAHYRSWRPDGAELFLGKYDETISWIAWNPDQFPQVLGRIQRAIVKRSYYVVYYRQEAERTVVLAVLDGRMNPATVRGMVRQRFRKRR